MTSMNKVSQESDRSLGERDVCVARIGDEVFAIADRCTHSEASLSEGEISNYKIECWLHGAEFDLRTGEALTPPAVEKLETFEKRFRENHNKACLNYYHKNM